MTPPAPQKWRAVFEALLLEDREVLERLAARTRTADTNRAER